MVIGGEKWASRFFCWMKMNRLSTNFDMERSKLWNVSEKRPKMTKNIFQRKSGNYEIYPIWQTGSKTITFCMYFHIWLSKNPCTKKEKLHPNQASHSLGPGSWALEMYKRNEECKLELGGKKRASSIFCWRKIHVLNTNFNMPGSKIWNIIEKRPKIAKHIFLKSLEKL